MSHHEERPEKFEKKKVRKLPHLTNSEWNELKSIASPDEIKSGIVSEETWNAFLKLKAPRNIRNLSLED